MEAAARRVAGRTRRTPVAEVRPGLWFKYEFTQYTGSFKARGAVNRIHAAAQRGELDPAVGVVAASGGNAGLAFAWVAREIGVPAEIWVPTTAPAVKVANLRALGATVRQHGTEYTEAYEAAVKRAADRGAVHCHAYDQPEVVAGQSTLGVELAEQLPGGFDTVLVSVGGGGLMAGVAAALHGTARVVGVEPTGCPTLHRALAAGAPVDVTVSGVAVDSLGARRIGDIAYATAVHCGVGSVLVPDESIVEARHRLWREHRVVVEHGAAAAYAAVAAGAYVPAEGERVVVVLCGANTDPSDLG
jgi:threonine dehydratase